MTVDMVLKDFLDDLSSKKPTPGGGGAAALCGSMASALTAMVCNLTVGKKKYADVSGEMEEILTQTDSLSANFNQLIDDDAEVFQKLLDAFKLPKDTEEEKQHRSENIQEATKKAALVPMEIIKNCVAVLPLASAAASKGNINAVSDAGVSALLIGAAAQSAALNVNINLMGISDRKWASDTFDEMNRLLNDVRIGTDAVLKIVSEKLNG